MGAGGGLGLDVLKKSEQTVFLSQVSRQCSLDR